MTTPIPPGSAPLLVVYDAGSAGPADIARALESVAPVHFVVSRTDHVVGVLPLLEALAPVHVAERGLLELVDDCRALRPGGIVTFSERALAGTAELAQALTLPHNSTEACGVLGDKNAQRRTLQRHGVGGVRFARLDEPQDWFAAVEQVGLPLVLKPRVGEGSRNTFLVTDADVGYRLAAQLLGGPEATVGLVVEEYLRGRESRPFGDFVSVESAVSHGVVSHVAVTGKFPLADPFREHGQFWPSALNQAEEDGVMALVSAALEAVDFTVGLAHTEVKLTADGPRILEINGRMGGFMNDLARRSSGIDLVGLAGRVALGEDIDVPSARTDEVVFQYNNQPPPAATRLEAVDGRSGVRRLQGVDAYTVLGRLPRELTGGVKSQELDLLAGRAPTHDAMLGVVDEALAGLVYSFVIESEVVHMSLARNGSSPGAAHVPLAADHAADAVPRTAPAGWTARTTTGSDGPGGPG